MDEHLVPVGLLALCFAVPVVEHHAEALRVGVDGLLQVVSEGLRLLVIHRVVAVKVEVFEFGLRVLHQAQHLIPGGRAAHSVEHVVHFRARNEGQLLVKLPECECLCTLVAKQILVTRGFAGLRPLLLQLLLQLRLTERVGQRHRGLLTCLQTLVDVSNRVRMDHMRSQLVLRACLLTGSVISRPRHSEVGEQGTLNLG